MNAENPQTKIGSIHRSWLITKSTWRLLQLDTKLLTITLISWIVCMIIGVVGVVGGLLLSPDGPLYVNGQLGWSHDPHPDISGSSKIVFVATALVVALLSVYTVAAIIAIALKRLRGGQPTLADGIDAVTQRFGSLTLYALFSFGIGYILQLLQENLPFIGKVLAFLGQLAWRVASFFAIAVIVDAAEFVNPIAATKQSISLIQRSWKESGVNRFTMAAIFMLLIVLELIMGTFVAVAAGVLLGSVFGIVVGVLLVMVFLFTILVSSTMTGIAKAVLYHFAVTGEVPEQFDRRLVSEAFTAKGAR